MPLLFMRCTVVTLAVALAAGAALASATTLTARGNEPFWRLEIGEKQLSFEVLGTEPAVTAAIQSRSVVDGNPRITATATGGEMAVTIIQKLCADTMSGMPFPVGVEVSYGDQRFTGCGGEIMTAIEGGWRAIRIGAEALPEAVTVTMVFERDGTVSGQSGCNRYSGEYTLSGEGLSFEQMALTRMACPPPQMETEQRVLDLLKTVTRITPGDNGQLRLMAGDELALVLDRAR
jgi:heat shock protein HslJ